MRRFRVSPSMAVASLALLVALGGTSFAAVSTLPRHSVTNAALASGSVDSRVVKNRSLKSADFAVGQIPKGPRGPQGPPGQPGTPGAAGTTGPPGPSDAYLKNLGTGTLNIASGGTTVGTLSIPQAGNYLIIAKVGVSSSDVATGDVRCTLTAGGDTDTGTVTLGADGRGVITTIVGHQYSAAGTATVFCTQTINTASTVNAGQVRIAAIKTGTLTQS